MVHRLGVDVGGTNTDAAILGAGNKVIGYAKALTSSDVISGIKESVSRVLSTSAVGADLQPRQHAGLASFKARSPELPRSDFHNILIVTQIRAVSPCVLWEPRTSSMLW